MHTKHTEQHSTPLPLEAYAEQCRRFLEPDLYASIKPLWRPAGLLAGSLMAPLVLSAQSGVKADPDALWLDALHHQDDIESSAGLQYVDVEPDAYLSSGYAVDLDADGSDDLIFTYRWDWGYGGWACYYSNWRFGIEIEDGQAAWSGTAHGRRLAERFAEGDTINGAQDWTDGVAAMAFKDAHCNSNGSGICTCTTNFGGAFFGTDDTLFAGFRLNLGGLHHYGWARVLATGGSMVSPRLKLLDYAWDATAGRTLLAGQTAMPSECAPPDGLQSASDSSGVTLSWNPVAEAWGYRLEVRKTGFSWTKFLASADTFKRVEQPIPAGLTAEWRVRAACAADTSGWSDAQSVGMPSVRQAAHAGNAHLPSNALDPKAMTLGPIPTRDMLRVHWPGHTGPTDMVLYNAQAQAVWQGRLSGQTLLLSLESFPPGVYSLQVQHPSAAFVRRLIRQ